MGQKFPMKRVEKVEEEMVFTAENQNPVKI